MKELPIPPVYELEYEHLPWEEMIPVVLAAIHGQIPYGGTVLDLMCGPGYLLGLIHLIRPDLRLVGVDTDHRYIEHARAKYPKEIVFVEADARTWETVRQYDCVLCTAGIHHLPYEDQEAFICRLAALTSRPDGLCVVAESCVKRSNNETERRLAAAELGNAYLMSIIQRGSPDSMIKVAIDILHNDVLADGEYKRDLGWLVRALNQAFGRGVVHKSRMWPEMETAYGDYCLVCRP